RTADADGALKPEIPAKPLAEATAHHLLEVRALEPWQLLGKKSHALAIAAGHAGDVGTPEEAVGPVSIEDPMQPVMQVLERIGLRRVARSSRGFERDIGELGERAKLVELAESRLILFET